jgi:hypothetical protein
MENPVEQSISAVENARHQIKLLAVEYNQLYTERQTEPIRERLDAINNEMIPHFATLDAANEKLV